MLPSAPLNSKMVMMMGGNDFDLNQQGPAIMKVPQTFFKKKKKKGFCIGFESSKKAFAKVLHFIPILHSSQGIFITQIASS